MPAARRHAHRADAAAPDKVDLDGALPHEQLGLAGIHRSRRMGLEALLLGARNGLADGLVDAPQRLFAPQGVVGKHQIEIDREPRHVAHGIGADRKREILGR